MKCGKYTEFKQEIAEKIKSEFDAKAIKNWLSKIDEKARAITFDTQVYMSITENLGKHKIFGDWIRQSYQIKKNVSDDDFKAVIFQMAWNLLVLQKFEIRHNDLHMGNICIQKLASPQLFSFEVQGKIFTLKTKYKLVFIDWDRAAIPGLEKYTKVKVINTVILNLCDVGKGCNNSNPAFDHYFISCLLLGELSVAFKDDESKQKREFIESFASGFTKQQGTNTENQVQVIPTPTKKNLLQEW